MTSREDHPGPTGTTEIFKENSENACPFEEISAASDAYYTADGELNMQITGLVEASSTDFRLQSMKPVSEGVWKLLSLRWIRFTIDPRPT